MKHIEYLDKNADDPICREVSMRIWNFFLFFTLLTVFSVTANAKDHAEGRDYILKNSYKGPKTCEFCHPGTARMFLDTVHWKHAAKVSRVENLDPKVEYGMKNRIYTMCNGNDVVSNLKEITNPEGKKKFTGCNSCHFGDKINDVGSTGPLAEASIDCLLCHSTKYDYSKRKTVKLPDGRIKIEQDRSVEAAINIGKPANKVCMFCHESAGGGALIKRGFTMVAADDAHAAKGMICIDCHKPVNHKFPTGLDPNNWASDGIIMTCTTGKCHPEKPHKDSALNSHIAKIACQTCHIPKTGGSFSKDFTKWVKLSNGFWEPATLKKEVNETEPVYAWFNGTVANQPHFIGPKGSRTDGKSKIYPFKIFQGKAFYNKLDGKLLTMDFGPPMSNGDTLAGVASAAKIMGIKKYLPVPGWQTIYFGSNHHVAPKAKSLGCANCHAPNGVLDFRTLGYSDKDIARLTSPELYFDKVLSQQED